MRDSLNMLMSFLFDMVALPRPTERVVRQLTIERLRALALRNLQGEGGLPYHAREARALVWELKYHASARAASLAGEFLSERLLGEAADSIGRPLLIPVPMHPARRRERGYNQTELLCEAALKALQGSGKTVIQNSLGIAEDFLHDSFAGAIFDYAPDILERIKNTTPQQGLLKYKRLRNVKNSMRVKDPARVVGRVCVVVDDVSTTGATLLESARALRRAGASSVVGIALAHS
ncbi:MAG: ComF family protein [Patescibacteria group bacterium]|nr:ComF family protein [Patescibacteria group bacterium]